MNQVRRPLVPWRVASSMTTALVLDALEHALFTRAAGIADVTGLISHSDAGSISQPERAPPQRTALSKASCRMSKPSVSKSGAIVRGGRKRKTFPKVPQVKVTRPCA